MAMYCIVIRRDVHDNDFSGKAQYRVTMCTNGKLPNKRKVMRMGSVFAIQTPIYYQPNSFVNPRKALGLL